MHVVLYTRVIISPECISSTGIVYKYMLMCVQRSCVCKIVHVHMFTVSVLLVEGSDLTAETGLSVTVAVNTLCPDAVYPVIASFGVRMNGSTVCDVQQSVTDSVERGKPVTLRVDPDSVTLAKGEYCVVVSSNGTSGQLLP